MPSWINSVRQQYLPHNLTQGAYLSIQGFFVVLIIAGYLQSIGQWAWAPLGIAILLMPAGFVIRMVTKKTATASFSSFTSAGPVWGGGIRPAQNGRRIGG